MVNGRWNQAVREATPLKSQILKRIHDGESVRQIWRALRADGQITVALSNFYVQVRKLSQKATSPLSPHSIQKSLNLPAVISQRPDDALADGLLPGFVRVPAIQGQMKLLTPDQLKERKDED